MTSIVNARTIELPIVLSCDEAARVAEKMLYRAWVERDTYALSLPLDYIDLDAGDVLSITLGGNTYKMRILSSDSALPGILRVIAVAEYSAQYTSTVSGSIGEYTAQTVTVPGPTFLRMLDLPAVRDADAVNAGYYYAGCGYVTTWQAAVLYRSSDAGVTYISITSINVPAYIGHATDALSDAVASQWDETNTVNITMLYGSLTSDTAINVLNGENTAALGSEIIAFRTATLEADGTYTLSGLVRGLYGTEWATNSHAVGDAFTLLDANNIYRQEVDNSEIGQARKYKAVTVGQSLQITPAQSFTFNAVNLKPYSPVSIQGSRDGSNNLTITWKRRSRYTSATLWSPILGESTESYEVDVMDGVTVKRTITATSETASYTAAQQTTDGFTPGDPITVNIYQLSAVVGRGYAGNEVV